MSTYHATVEWTCEGDFLARRYSRAHVLKFDGATVPGSASPSIVPAPYSTADAVDPEEMFVASLSSCHMLWFLDFAAREGFLVESYHDEASGLLAQNGEGKLAMTEVVLRPDVRFGGERQPTPHDLLQLHMQAHDACFIANSVRTALSIHPVFSTQEEPVHG